MRPCRTPTVVQPITWPIRWFDIGGGRYGLARIQTENSFRLRGRLIHTQ
jgi:hypothetical protein